MKSMVLLVFLICLVAFEVHSADSSRGCGVGTMAVPKKTLLGTTTAGTVEGSVCSGLTRVFALTSGTSGCAQHSIIKNDVKKDIFIAVNYDQLKLESSQGKGEVLYGLASLFGCPLSKHVNFNSLVKDNFSELFDGKQSEDRNQVLLKKIKRKVEENADLSSACTLALI